MLPVSKTTRVYLQSQREKIWNRYLAFPPTQNSHDKSMSCERMFIYI